MRDLICYSRGGIRGSNPDVAESAKSVEEQLNQANGLLLVHIPPHLDQILVRIEGFVWEL